MKVLLIGASGTIGKRLKECLELKHELVLAGKHSGMVQLDLANVDSIKAMFKNVGRIDAVICVAGEAKWDQFENMTEEDYYHGLKNKLMGQVSLVRWGKDYVSFGGSITLTSGVLADDPVYMSTSAAMVNGALHSFVKAVALELDNVRVNVVCSDLVEDSYEKYKDYFPGHTPVSMKRVADAYLKSLEGRIKGEIIRVKA
ncbi:MAG: short chain dehydrogenase [Algoriphagus sp.]|jgi:NAD(P)-dependent dehydrogenase (short-subunit alcohol dehydrogenase family)|uniref:short chain dehydrogenase n=1 Tax=Algoriphagus sp. TaxID=1872435 RepID=UPI00271B5E5D|nr:short chain dehydrogenase [Algoriphagus sp.]MDO8965225.1 short chain dehydrogenase [Algoriphagus sp.]MDP2039547.1 short chain dehydrogenase [Algoriphagus sp.]MDP3199016.1 short chain dehydrogenase [Algoriphagus sp.]MDP3474342.1 short chain dehydrogenase [Algoriphagus sp.]